MSIGVFDSGVGGLTIHRALIDRMATGDFIYLADQANMPYGEANGEEIAKWTRNGCERLFLEGCDLVLLACNTASAIALRRLQKTWLPDVRHRLGRPVNVLGIIVPTIEVLTGKTWAVDLVSGYNHDEVRRVVGVFSTKATARSQVYEIEIAKRCQHFSVISEPCQDLARFVEQGVESSILFDMVCQHVDAMVSRVGHVPSKVILGSTHYEVIADIFREVLTVETEIIRQPHATADALETYLVRHPEINPGESSLRLFLTTDKPRIKNTLIEMYWGESLVFEAL